MPEFAELPEGWRYAVWQRERCPTTGREHLQMYFELTAQKALSTVRAMYVGDIEVARGTAEQNRVYCMKEGRLAGPWELGERVCQGQRNDVRRAIAVCRKRGFEAAVVECPEVAMKFPQGLRVQAQVWSKKRRVARGYVQPKILVLVGSTGCGKTRAAVKLYGRQRTWLNPLDSEWWDGYDGEKVVVLDDFYGQLKYSRMLQLLDGEPQQRRVPVKGAFVTLENDVWVLTSNVPPWEWWSGAKMDRSALYHRLWSRFDSAVLEWQEGRWTDVRSPLIPPRARIEQFPPPPVRVE